MIKFSIPWTLISSCCIAILFFVWLPGVVRTSSSNEMCNNHILEKNIYSKSQALELLAKSSIKNSYIRSRRDILKKIEDATSKNLGNNTSDLHLTFNQGFIDLSSRDPIEEGAATLAFVFDTTGSMYDDLKQVIEGADKIFKTVLEKFERPIHNYVLVPFNDPGKSSILFFCLKVK